MLITNGIEIKITKQNIDHYLKIGKKVNLKDVIFVSIEEMPKNSHRIVDVECDICNEKMKMTVQTYNTRFSCLNYITCKKCSIDKFKKLNFMKYGTDNFLTTEQFKEKSRKTKTEKYGNANYNNSEKNKKTCLKKYGKEHILQVDEYKKKLKKTYLERYGNENYANVEKFKKTCLEKYGEISAMKNIHIKNMSINTKMKKRIPILSKYGIENVNDDNKYICNKGHVIEMSNGTLRSRILYNITICPICNPLFSYNSSYSEDKLYDFIKDNYSDIIERHSRKIIKNEIDIYLPDLKLGFEFNGLFWHNEIGKNKDYHLKKTEECEKQGIKLIHIYEDDWLYKQEIVKSRILNLLNKTSNKIYARKCQIKEVTDNKLIREFLETNHIQGFVGSKVKIGLFYQEELVSLMTFGDKRKSMGQKAAEDSYEMLRFCNRLNTSVVGGASRLFKYFIKIYNPKEVISYADRSWSQGELYKNLGFKLIHKTKPNYYYIIDGIRKYRFGFRKDVLIKNGYDPDKTEHEIMLERGIYRIYDSGQIKYSYEKII